MRTTMRGLYALRAMLALAAESSRDKPVALHRIAQQEDISAEFLQQIFFRLRKAGLIAAFRGPGGGFFLLKDKSDISVLEILEAAGESIKLSPCALSNDCAQEPCANIETCNAGHFWTSLESQIRSYASSKSLADLMKT